MNPHALLIDAAGGRCVGARQGTKSASLAEAVRSTAAAFRAAGIRPGEFVVVLTDVSPECALAYLGAMYAGCVVVPVDARRDAHNFRGVADQVNISAIWAPTQDSLAAIDPGLVAIFTGVLAGETVRGRAIWRADQSGRLAALMLTSGSTGRPRLVRVTHENLIANTIDIVATQDLSARDRAMLVVPLSYCFGASVLHSHLAVGGDVVFDRRMVFPDRVVKAIGQHKCTTFAGVPTVYSMLLNHSVLQRGELRSLVRWLQAGGRLEPGEIDRVRASTPGTDFYVMYGQTEATARILCLQPSDIDRKRGSVGQALPSLKICIAQDTGEVMVSGPSVTDGYWRDPGATAERFQLGWLRTGDRGHLDAEGFLWLEGRTADFIKVAGVRLALGEVEGRLRCLKGVREAGAVGVPHEELGEALAVFVVRDPSVGSEQVEKAIFASLPAHWMIATVRVIDELPTNMNGKVDRLKLVQMALG